MEGISWDVARDRHSDNGPGLQITELCVCMLMGVGPLGRFQLWPVLQLPDKELGGENGIVPQRFSEDLTVNCGDGRDGKSP